MGRINYMNKNIPKGTKATMGDVVSQPMVLGGGFEPPKNRYVTSIYNQLVGKREELIADLEVYLNNPVGVGEHQNIGEVIKEKIEQIDKYDSMANTLRNHFFEDSSQPTNESEAP